MSGGLEDDFINFSLEKSNENFFLGELYKLKLNVFVSFRMVRFFNLFEYNILLIFEKW